MAFDLKVYYIFEKIKVRSIAEISKAENGHDSRKQGDANYAVEVEIAEKIFKGLDNLELSLRFLA